MMMMAKTKAQLKTLAALELVFSERLRQEELYGDVNLLLEDGTGPEVQWLKPFSDWPAHAIQSGFREEYERNGHSQDDGRPTRRELLMEEVAEALELDADSPEFLTEIIQVAALCVAWAERKMS